MAGSLSTVAITGVLVGTAHAATGSATAQAADVELGGAATVGGLNLGLGLAGATTPAQAPATDGTDSQGGGLNITALTAAAAIDVTSTSATRSGATTSAESTVNSSGVTAFGTSVLSTGVISSNVTCPAGGTPSATVNPTNVAIGGTAVDATAGASGNVTVTVAGLLGANVAVTVSAPHSTTATSAAATGLLADLTLTGTTLVGGTAVNVPLGTVALATTSCQSPDPTSAVAPTISSITPDNGPTYGGQTVTITGTDFVPGQTEVSFGGLPATDVNVTSPTSLTATTPVSPTDGSTTVTVSTPAGASGPLAYTYVGPKILAINPDQGPTTGGQVVTITGSGFAPGAAVTIRGVAATAVNVDPSGTSITATTPAGAVGPADVAVVQPGPDAMLANGYTYIAPGAPTIDGINPDNGPVSGGQTVTITGSGFVPGATTVAFDGTPGAQVTVNSPTSLTLVAPAHVAGPVDVRVTNPFGDSGTRRYTYVAAFTAAAAAPGGTAVEGNSAVAGTGSGLPFTGANALIALALGALLLVTGGWCAAVRRRGAFRH